ncbi:MAG TPA: YihY/virulence factor BrkB family protein [Nitrospira sp.]
MKGAIWRAFLSGGRVVVAALQKFFADNGFFLASALAFNLLLYFIPLSLLMISLLGYTVLDSERAMNEVQSALKAFLPRSQQALADNLSAVVADRGLLGLFGFASFVAFSTFLFGSVRAVLNRVFQVKQERTFVKGMGVDLLMMGLTALLMLLAVGTTWSLATAVTFSEQSQSWSSIARPGLVVLGKVFTVAVTVLLFYVLYRFSPASTLSGRALMIASVTGSALFQIAKWGFTWYVEIAQQSLELYGALGGLMFLFVWLYYASLVLIIGAEAGWAYDHR